MDISWEDIRLFLAVEDAGSMSAAARRLRIGQPTVSRRLAELEEGLGYLLFQRSVDGVAITSDGERLLEPARRMAEWAAELDRAAEGQSEGPAGVVRITAPPGIAFDFLAPFAAWLGQRSPELRLEVLSSVHYLDLSRREADLALRHRAPTQRDLSSVARVHHENAAFAAPSYVRRLPECYTISDVDWIGWAPPFEQLSPNPELEALIPGFRPVFASDDFLVQLSAAEAGVGAIFLGRVLHRFSRLRALEELALDIESLPTSELHLVASKGALALPRVRQVAELIAEELANVRALPRRTT